MKKKLLDVLFMSEKRKQALRLLKDGAKETEYLLKSIGTTRQLFLPQIKMLEEHHLVIHYDDTYELTQIGKLIVDEMSFLLDTIDVLDYDIDYWGGNNFDFIPPHLLKRLNELGDCKIIDPGLAKAFAINKEFIENANKSSSLYLISTYIHPSIFSLISQLIEKDVSISFILSKELLQIFENEQHDELKHFIASEKVKFYLYNGDLRFLSLSLCDNLFILRSLSINNEISNKQILGNDPNSCQWAKELFDYYLEDSTLLYENMEGTV